MRIEDHLTKEQKKQLEKVKSPRKNENLSTKDIEELMGMNMPVYTRRNGAVRRR